MVASAAVPVKDLNNKVIYVIAHQITHFRDMPAGERKAEVSGTTKMEKYEAVPAHMEMHLADGTVLQLHESSVEFVKRCGKYSNVMRLAE